MVLTVKSPDAIVVTNRGGFIQSMNPAAEALLGFVPTRKVRSGQIGALFVKGRIGVRTALRDVHPGGAPVQRPASILPIGRALLPLTVSITGLDDGFRWVLRPAISTRPSRELASRGLRAPSGR